MAQHNPSEQDIIFISDDEIIVISDDDDDDDIFFTAPNSPTIQTTAVTTKPPTLLGINDRLKALRISREPSKPLATNHTIPERASSRHRITKHPIGNDDSRYMDRLSIGERVVFRKRHHDRYHCFDVSDTFESYTYDYTHVDHLPLSKDDYYEPYSAPWLRWKRKQYFESLVVRRDDVCVECKDILTRDDICRNNGYLIRKRKRGPYCYLCSRLFSFPVSLNEEIEIMEYLLSGELSPKEEVANGLTIKEVIKAFDARSRLLRSRSYRVGSEIASAEPIELLALVAKSNMRCAITNSKIFFRNRKDRPRYWVFSIDHITPLSIESRKYRDGSRIKNLQITCHIINYVKGSVLNDEFSRWWKQLRETKIRASKYYK
ncbi:hypothetical protein G6F37_000078 [Rhizopus arrhizus]|nr:hypothetical protein G6F38_007417 [Rhizopus arrhizus]KAG1164648.1 hypothetical protein G6F37_000078 [Rhizopus arrhizus]